jgi:hypothetical protein
MQVVCLYLRNVHLVYLYCLPVAGQTGQLPKPSEMCQTFSKRTAPLCFRLRIAYRVEERVISFIAQEVIYFIYPSASARLRAHATQRTDRNHRPPPKSDPIRFCSRSGCADRGGGMRKTFMPICASAYTY